jgi:1-deoxy-D-xylulose-5-phosphate reductoisomerase
MMRPVVILGATGSIGTQTLEVVEGLGLEVVGLAARRPSPEMAGLARSHPDARVVVTGGSEEEREDFARMAGCPVEFGTDAMVDLAGTPGTTVVNGVVGAAGLRASVAALEAGNRLALANKESLVAGGPVVIGALERGGGELIPVDSEHSAIHQSLVGEEPDTVQRILLTASGGPFRGWDRERLSTVTPAQALAHPTWDMGQRITIDSATLFNKGLEVIEAHFLFGLDYDRIDVVVHPQSVLHSVVEFVDGSWKGHLGYPDMRIPIQYAITYPTRRPSPARRFDFAGNTLVFEEADREAFPALDIAYAAGRAGGSAPAVLNAADEVAVAAFLQERIGFTSIPRIVELALEQVEHREIETVDDVIEVDQEARSVAASLVSGAC